MKSRLKKNLSHILSTVIVLIILFTFQKAEGQLLNKKLCQEFHASDELYVLDIPYNIKEVMIDGKNVSLEKLVRENWSNKTIKLISKKEYNRMKDVKGKFFISILTYSIEKEGITEAEIQGVIIKKGRVVNNNTIKFLYWYSLDVTKTLDGIMPERLIYLVKNLKDILDNYDDGSFRNRYVYKYVDYKKILESGTLYVIKDNLIRGLHSEEELKKYYSYPFKFVTNQEKTDAIKNKKEGVLFLNETKGIKFSAVDLYSAEDGKLLIASFPWLGKRYIDGAFFDKAVN